MHIINTMTEPTEKLEFADELTPIQFGIGTWQWGDRLFWGYGKQYSQEDCRGVFDAALSAGVHFFDTAEVYGQGASEVLLGQFIRDSKQSVLIATKFMPYPWRLTRKSFLRALRASLQRLGVDSVFLYQIHQPIPLVRVETWMEAMIEAHHLGLIKAIGVSNYNLSLMLRAHDALAKEGLTLYSNQVEYSLIERGIEKTGLMDKCKSMGIKIIAYSPLAQGILTGKYTLSSPPRGIRAGKYSRNLIQGAFPVIELLKRIGSDHGGKSAGQVALNWVMQKGAIPIPGAKNLDQAENNLGAVGWQLTDQEIVLLDEASARIQTH